MSEQREPQRPSTEDEAEERSGLKRPNDEVKDLETPEEKGEDIRGGVRASKFNYK